MSKPLLDVSALLSDPDFADTTLTVTRNVQTVGADGVAVNTPTVFAFTGVVTAGAGSRLWREDTGSRIDGDIRVATTFTLLDGSRGTDADLVTWNGRQYTVAHVKDWSSYGAGFVIAACALLPLEGS